VSARDWAEFRRERRDGDRLTLTEAFDCAIEHDHARIISPDRPGSVKCGAPLAKRAIAQLLNRGSDPPYGTIYESRRLVKPFSRLSRRLDRIEHRLVAQLRFPSLGHRMKRAGQ
jgi:hypothetical protein